MVRLKGKNTEGVVIIEDEFQFQNGAIKSASKGQGR